MTEAKDNLCVGLIQMRSSRDVEENLKDAVSLIRDAASKGASYIQTPENTLLMEADSEQLLAKIAPEQGTRAIPIFADLAKQLGVWLHIGSLAIKTEDGRAANRAFLFAPNGKIVARYDKIHMFDVNLANGESYRESATFNAGNSALLVRLPWGGLGITTCYDLRFPEQYKALARAGAKFLAVPSAFTKVTGEAHWHVLLRARAIENGCFVFAAAQGGRHASGRTTYGHSLVISPWGEVLAEAEASPAVLVVKIDIAEVDRVRKRIPSLDHTRDFELSVIKADARKLMEAAG